ncbi:DegV family protein [Isachenkonia alkalipeptolytica]|uniref:DegV family protein n=1 Tax=Isachenkonia alkalipeptolytica TaxID=2565777 RepID=A0AA43XI82_9CLOT|nr:DegV family protein [Isachenkonia alkalipeptolytica]NBG87272.1 DegV family protein [Isachenkonia alkalipeptolytica]
MIKIIADSTCDLSEEILEKYDIQLASLKITIEGKVYRDRVDISPDEFYEQIENYSEPPTTGMPSPTEFTDLMEKAVTDGYKEILCICMSSGTSGSYQSAELGKKYFHEKEAYKDIPVHVVDSKSMSHGSGWLILKSARLREQGATYQELIDFNESYKLNLKHFLSVDDLNHLIRSGRLSNASAFFGKILRLKPIMTMKDAKGAIVAKERGRKRVLEHYVSAFNKRVDEELTDFIIIGYTSDINYAKNLQGKIETETDFNGEIFIMQMGVAVGTHVGLGGLALYFIEKDRMKDNLLRNEWESIVEKKNQFLKKYGNE